MSPEKPFYPAMLDQAVYTNDVQNHFFWYERSPEEQILDDALYEYHLSQQEYAMQIKDLAWLKRRLQLDLTLLKLKNEYKRKEFSARLLKLNVTHTLRMKLLSTIKVSNEISYRIKRVYYQSGVNEALPETSTLAYMAGVGTSLRMALATEANLANGNTDKALLTAGIGIVSLATPFIVSRLFKKSSV